jgi:hypothetical protein
VKIVVAIFLRLSDNGGEGDASEEADGLVRWTRAYIMRQRPCLLIQDRNTLFFIKR